MKKSLLFLLAVCFFASFMSAQVKVGVVNANKIIMNIEKGKSASRSLNDFIQETQKKAKAIQDEIDAISKELTNPALNDATRRQKAAVLDQKRTEMQRFQQDSETAFLQKRQTELEPIQKELLDIIMELAKAEKFTLILDASQDQQVPNNLIYFDETIDLSMRVAEIYNQRNPVTAAPNK